ncbi:hypothetical protein KEM55_006370 [Ascosphaera atra]|nr:hypothetical protein KEM55_006370 [Ascosphaera atra]
MSSMRNAVQRRNHRERGQLEGREKWGLLEKHKDYSLRAKDYNVKKAKLKRLREKARDRNPDEFAFGMMSSESNRQGRHGARDPTKTLSHDAVKLLKTQDAGYLRTVSEKVRRQLEKAEKELKLQEGIKRTLDSDERGSGVGKKVIYVDTPEEQEEASKLLGGSDSEFDDEEEGDEEDMEFGEEDSDEKEDDINFAEPPKPTKPLSKKEMEKEEQARKQEIATRRMKKRAQEVRRRRVEILKKQYNDLKAAEQELEMQRAKMAHAVGGVNKDGVKWKVRERKR